MGTSASTTRYTGRVAKDVSAHDVIIDRVELKLLANGTRFELRWNQRHFHLTSTETVFFSGAIVDGFHDRQRFLRVENRPVSEITDQPNHHLTPLIQLGTTTASYSTHAQL